MTSEQALRPARHRFTTDELPARQQFAAYHSATSGVFGVEPLGGVLPARFPAEQIIWSLGMLALRRIRDDGVRFHRLARQARRDMLDHWSVTLYVSGESRGLVAGTAYRTEAGAPMLYGLQQPLVSERGRSDLLTLFIPRTTLPDVAPVLDARAGRVLTTPLGRLLGSYLMGLAQTMERLDAGDVARTSEATLAILRATIAGGRDDIEAARPSLEAALRARLLAIVRGNIRSARLDPERLARLAGMSRSSVYRVFDGDGGVARMILRERLRLISAALADPNETRSIGRIAEDFGMPDPSVFSRAFRRELGMTPREFRDAAGFGAALPAEAQPLLRLLRGCGSEDRRATALQA